MIKEHIITFGKYRGQRVIDVIAKDPNYLWWADENVSKFSLTINEKKILLLNSLREDESSKSFGEFFSITGSYINNWYFDYNFKSIKDIEKFFRNKDIKDIYSCSIAFGNPHIDLVDEKGNVDTFESVEERTRREDNIIESFYTETGALQYEDTPTYGPM